MKLSSLLTNKYYDSKNQVLAKIYSSGYYLFKNRAKGNEKLLYILAGYKPLLWENVFGRIKKFIPSDIDVCVISSGKYVEELDKICQLNNWSYLSTKWNKLTVAQNKAILLHPKAHWIYKLDEDMFITEGFFEVLFQTFNELNQNSCYKVGYVSPLVPIHSYGLIRYLEKENLFSDFLSEIKKSTLKIDRTQTLYSPKTATFIWNQCKQIDLDSYQYQLNDFCYSVAPCRLSICAILFTRTLWKEMNMFKIGRGNGGGDDEAQISAYCASNYYTMICAENNLAYHFAFAKQEKLMYAYYKKNMHKFQIQNIK